MGLDAVTLTTVKHPRSLGQMPPLSAHPAHGGRSADHVPEARLLFSGTAEEAIRRFPANVNVAVSLGLAGLGFSVRGCACSRIPVRQGLCTIFRPGPGTAHWKR